MRDPEGSWSEMDLLALLQDIQGLKVLWLGDNEAAKVPHYRATVLAFLPGLSKLDNVGEWVS
jgi:hypothetical protein